jgi:hypothetical protein
MNLLKFLFKKCRGMVVVTGCSALLGGACNAGLIALVNVVVNDPDGTRVACCLASRRWRWARLSPGSFAGLADPIFATRDCGHPP